jgi:hypothetical protein
MRVSSAYCIIGYFFPKSSSIGRARTPLFHASLIIACSNSEVLTKRSGNRGSPYLIALLQIIFFPGTPFRRIDVESEFKIDLISDIHLLPKKLACNIARIALYSTLSKAFSKSIFMIMMGFFLYMTNVQIFKCLGKAIFLPLMNPYWF